MLGSDENRFGNLKSATSAGFAALGGFILVAILGIAAGVFRFEFSQPNKISGEPQILKRADAAEAGLKNKDAETVFETGGKFSAEKSNAAESPPTSVSETPAFFEPKTVDQPKSAKREIAEINAPLVSPKPSPDAKPSITPPPNLPAAPENFSGRETYSPDAENNRRRRKISEQPGINNRRMRESDRTMGRETRTRQSNRAARRKR